MLLNEDVQNQVKDIFNQLKGNAKIKVFTQEFECQYCQDTRSLAEEIASLSDKVTVEVHDFQKDKETAEKYNIDKIPALVVEGEKDFGIRFYGIPGGYEFSSLLEAIKLASGEESELSENTRQYLDSLNQEVHLQVFVTPTCPYCPSAVVTAYKMAQYSDKVTADGVEISEFPQIGNKYAVQGVPKTVINETTSQEGAAPEDMIIDKIKENTA